MLLFFSSSKNDIDISSFLYLLNLIMIQHCTDYHICIPSLFGKKILQHKYILFSCWQKYLDTLQQIIAGKERRKYFVYYLYFPKINHILNHFSRYTKICNPRTYIVVDVNFFSNQTPKEEYGGHPNSDHSMSNSFGWCHGRQQ